MKNVISEITGYLQLVIYLTDCSGYDKKHQSAVLVAIRESNPPTCDGFSSQMLKNAEIVSMPKVFGDEAYIGGHE